MPNPIIEKLAGNARTTSATTTTLISFEFPSDDLSAHVHWTVVGKETTSGQITTYEAIASYDNTSGTVTKIGSTSSLHEVDEDTNVTFTEDASGSTARLRVTPSTDTTDWSAWATITFLRLP